MTGRTRAVVAAAGLVIAAGLVVMLLAAGVGNQEAQPEESASAPVNPQGKPGGLTIPVYTADVQVDPEARRVHGSLTVRFRPADPRHVYFHLYPNAFRDDAALDSPNWEYVLGKEREAGEIAIGQVEANGQPVPAEVKGTILKVSFPTALPNGQEAAVTIPFELRLPRNNGRMSYNDHALWLGNWLPILAVKDEAGWRLDPYLPMGDPFYSEAADYHLRIAIPAGYQLASTGVESRAVITETRPSRQKWYEVDGRRVRDFALVVMDETYHALTEKVGGTVLNTWWQEGDDPQTVKQLHDLAARSFAYYSEMFGNYPYPEYDVVKTGGFFGGMEYPGIVFIQDGYFDQMSTYGAAVVAHETAHQWFYGLVGSDEIREAWVDESLTDYATMAFLEQYDTRMARSYISQRLSRGRQADALYPELTVWQPLEAFPDWKSYSDLVYARGATMLWELGRKWGTDRVNAVLRRYVEAHRFGLGTGRDVVQAFTEAVGTDATPYFEYWLGFRKDKRSEAEVWAEAGARAMRNQPGKKG
ncbi:MAG: M1 family metallopeptidase [Brevibacillus sp.]|nr:M1 family metallopeptidase [Brevibacillus sp.]